MQCHTLPDQPHPLNPAYAGKLVIDPAHTLVQHILIQRILIQYILIERIMIRRTPLQCFPIQCCGFASQSLPPDS
jgi:hypothetical protein